MLAPPKPALGGHQLRKRLSSRSRSRSRSPSTDVGSLLSDDELSGPETPQDTNHTSSSSSKPMTEAQKPSIPQYTAKVLPPQPEQDHAVTTTHRSWRVRIQDFWDRNYGLMLVLIAQFFATMMNVTTGLLEDDGVGGGMHPFQILFARMSITVLISLVYMWWSGTPDWPFGAKGIRWLLVFRGVGGFWGVFGLYWSLQYLPLSDATVITFLAPTVSCWACSKFINEPFTRTEQLGGFISLAGVILIARPTYLFSSSTPPPTSPEDPSASPSSPSNPTPAQHLAAIGMAVLGVFGAASAYTTIRIIGNRAHPLISVTYFSFWCTLVSTVALLFVPSIPFVLPSTAYQWMLLLFIGLSGFIMQFLLTAGLRAEKSGRATNMIYTQMISALVAERVIWGTSPGAWSLAGSALILGAAAMVAVQKQAVTKSVVTASGPVVVARDEEEEAGMLLHDAEIHQIGDDDDEGHDRDDNDFEMQEREKRGRSISISINDDEPRRTSTNGNSAERADGLAETGNDPHVDPPGVWQFAHARHSLRDADRSEDVSPHSPAVHRKAPVFWGR